ncbi:MAG: glycoside hydrolase family 3 C-terminal domain-containing protein [Candidatus Sulfotelmatobacter sp.]
MTRLLELCRAMIGVGLLLVLTQVCGAYSVLTHEEVVDLLWKDDIQPLLAKRFPGASADDLKRAHAFAYGGSLIQDMGYYPFGNKYFSDLTHYVRTGDFVVNLLNEASDLNEYAFALGALSHYSADNLGHPTINQAVGLQFPKLRKQFGNDVTRSVERSMVKKPAVLLGALLCAAIWPASFAQEPSGPPPYKDPGLPLEQRVNDLVSRMTLEEKVSQLTHVADAVPRLGIPGYNWWNEGLHGVARAGAATVFPQAIAMAATFDEPLMRQIGDVISSEFRAKYYATVHQDGSADWYKGLTVWSPNINIFRDPRWGRGQETYGEDPYLASRMGVAFVEGLQGNDPKYFKTVATPKHFAVHSGPESTRHAVDIEASRHDIEDTYLPAFRATVIEGKAGSVMCAYNSLNGQPACVNHMLLTEHLRGDWGFKGYVVSDCGAVTDVSQGHHYAKSVAEGFAAALKGGTDLDCVSPGHSVAVDRDALLQAVHQGSLSESDVDRALHRLFRARFQLGMFDPPEIVRYSKIRSAENDSLAHRQLALKAARESIVLLKNRDGFLPLRKKYRTIAVIGPNADSLDALVGNYNGTPSHPVTVLAGIRKRFPQSKVVYVEGTGLIGPANQTVPAPALYTNRSRAKHGLKAEYFSNPKLEGSAVLTRTDANVNFVWGFSGVSPQLAKNYSVRWTGVLVPSESAEYVMGFTGQDGYRVWLDDQLIVEDWTTHRPATTSTKQIHLEKGHSYSIKIEYFQTVRGAEARLTWSIPGRQEQQAIEAARHADLVLVAMGLTARVEGEEMNVHADGFSGGDRTSIDLTRPQQELLELIVAAGKPAVLLLLNGSALAVNWADENVPAIIEAWYPGGQGGTAISEALAGDFCPGGRLPVTFYKSADQLPLFDDYSMAKRTYRYFDGEPLYPFGFGLSYTSFAYSDVKVDKDSVPADGSVKVSADVTNTGSMAGDEVVQLYLTHTGVAGVPIRALQGMERVHLARGAKKTVSFTLQDRALSIVDEAGKRRIVPGDVEVWIGGGQPVTRSSLPKPSGVTTRFSIVGEATLPD